MIEQELHSGMTCEEIQIYSEQIAEIRQAENKHYKNDSIYAMAMLIANLAARIKENA